MTTFRSRLIGAGGMGTEDALSSLAQDGVQIVAASDVYEGRLTRAKERWGNQVFTTRDYREVLARPDIDAVIVATPDHWHAQISIDAMNAGKDVYVEKPMVQKIADGYRVVEAQKKTGRILQVGSQRVSSIVYQKAKDLLKSGAIGQVNMIEAWWDRNSAIGAWQYSIPPDASTTRSIGIAFSAPRRRFPFSRSAYSAGATIGTTEPASRAIFSFTCSRACITSWVRPGQRRFSQRADCGSGKTAAMFRTSWSDSVTIPRPQTTRPSISRCA